MLAKTTLVAGVLLAGFVSTASAQTYYAAPGYGYYGAPYGPMGYYGAYGATGYRPYGMMGSPYSYQPTGTFQAYWTEPSTASAPPRAARVVSPRQSYAAAIQTPPYAAMGYYGPMGYGSYGGMGSYQPTGTFQALWESPRATAPTPPRASRNVSVRQSHAQQVRPHHTVKQARPNQG